MPPARKATRSHLRYSRWHESPTPSCALIHKVSQQAALRSYPVPGSKAGGRLIQVEHAGVGEQFTAMLTRLRCPPESRAMSLVPLRRHLHVGQHCLHPPFAFRRRRYRGAAGTALRRSARARPEVTVQDVVLRHVAPSSCRRCPGSDSSLGRYRAPGRAGPGATPGAHAAGWISRPRCRLSAPRTPAAEC